MSNIEGGAKKQQSKVFPTGSTQMIRGGLIGVAISALVSWNGGRYSRVGAALKRWKFTRNFILVKRKPDMPITTNYFVPAVDSVMNNFMCFSGEAGIGKSYHFQQMSYEQSGVRPSIYLSFKASGRDATFEEDIAEQLDYGADCPGILSEIIRAVKKIHDINASPYWLWGKFGFTNLGFLGAIYTIFYSSLEATLGMIVCGCLASAWLMYAHFMIPFIIQSVRRTIPLIIFDDLNKIQHLGMLSEVVRFLQLLENNMANVILVSSDEQTWSNLRREPGVKDRLRLRHMIYSHQFTALKLLEIIDQDYNKFMKYVQGNKKYNRQIIKSLIKELIGRRQVTMRRFISVLKLNDEEQYDRLVQVLENRSGKSTGEIVQDLTDILYESQTETMVSNLKDIKRKFPLMSEDEFFQQLHLLRKKGKLPSDNQIAPHLKSYNIVRDLRSEYVFNGRFMYTVFNMAIQEYEKDMREFREGDLNVKPILKAPISEKVDEQLQKQTLKQEES